jgi:hypothetical protein
MRPRRCMSPSGRAGRERWLRFGFRNGMFPSWLSLEAPAKSFVLRRCSNFIFPAPISCLGIAQLEGRLSAKGMPRPKDDVLWLVR